MYGRITVDLGTVETEVERERDGQKIKVKERVAPELEGVTVTFKNPRLMPMGRARELDSTAADIRKMTDVEEQRTANLNVSLDLVKQLVVAWDLTDPDTDLALPPPLDDPDVIDRVPTLAFAAISVAIGQARAQEPVPKGTLT